MGPGPPLLLWMLRGLVGDLATTPTLLVHWGLVGDLLLRQRDAASPERVLRCRGLCRELLLVLPPLLMRQRGAGQRQLEWRGSLLLLLMRSRCRLRLWDLLLPMHSGRRLRLFGSARCGTGGSRHRRLCWRRDVNHGGGRRGVGGSLLLLCLCNRRRRRLCVAGCCWAEISRSLRLR